MTIFDPRPLPSAKMNNQKNSHTRDKFQDRSPTYLPCGRHKYMVPYETPRKIAALDILQNIEFNTLLTKIPKTSWLQFILFFS